MKVCTSVLRLGQNKACCSTFLLTDFPIWKYSYRKTFHEFCSNAAFWTGHKCTLPNWDFDFPKSKRLSDFAKSDSQTFKTSGKTPFPYSGLSEPEGCRRAGA